MSGRPGPTIAACALLALLAGATAAAEDLGVFAGGTPAEGYLLMVGDPKRWDVQVGADGATTYAGYLEARPSGDGAIEATWNGEGDAQLFLAGIEPLDLGPMVAADGALVLLLSVADAPDDDVELRIGCGYPCGASAQVEKLLGALPTGEWFRVSFDLRCFADQGLEPGKVDAPFLLLTDSAMKLSIADVGFVEGLGPKATVRCR